MAAHGNKLKGGPVDTPPPSEPLQVPLEARLVKKGPLKGKWEYRVMRPPRKGNDPPRAHWLPEYSFSAVEQEQVLPPLRASAGGTVGSVSKDSRSPSLSFSALLVASQRH